MRVSIVINTIFRSRAYTSCVDFEDVLRNSRSTATGKSQWRSPRSGTDPACLTSFDDDTRHVYTSTLHLEHSEQECLTRPLTLFPSLTSRLPTIPTRSPGCSTSFDTQYSMSDLCTLETPGSLRYKSINKEGLMEGCNIETERPDSEVV